MKSHLAMTVVSALAFGLFPFTDLYPQPGIGRLQRSRALPHAGLEVVVCQPELLLALP